MAHLMNNAVWFGTENDMRWIPAPAANYTSQNVRWRATDQLLNGGARIRQSVASHKNLSLSWPVQSQESLAPIVSYLGSGGPFYYLDPINAQSNALPYYWSAPGAVPDGPPLIDDVDIEYSTASSTNPMSYPQAYATYAVPSGGKVTNAIIPVPDGYSLYLGYHGTGTGIAVGAQTAAAIPVTSVQRTNLVVSGPTLAQVRLLAGSHTIHGIIAQVLPDGQVPDPGGFLPGVGHSQLALANDPTITSYSAYLPNAQTGIAADFVEVGAWS